MSQSSIRSLSLLCSFILGIVILNVELRPAEAARSDAAKLPFSTPVDWNSLPPTALIETTKGAFELKLYREVAPVSVRNFEHLAKSGYYNNTYFYRHIPNFILQGGDPSGNGKGGPGYTLPPEYSEISHRRGTVGMARFPGQINPLRRSHGSQFYICLSRAQHLDGLYTVFGEVIAGSDVLGRLRKDDKIVRVLLPRSY